MNPSLGFTTVRGDDVLAAAEACERMLEPHLGADWGVAVPDLEFTVGRVVAHAAEVTLWYSVDLWSGRANAAFELRVLPNEPNERLLTSLTAASRALAAGVDAAPADTRGYHPMGSPDPEGFAAMACDELLVHGHDAARGLRAVFAPDPALAARVLNRLYPWHAAGPGEDPWKLLLWANGRTDLPGRTRQDRWRWHCGPLGEWDGTAPVP
jgi:mycothiol maleylpyruvate isomerase-like protein